MGPPHVRGPLKEPILGVYRGYIGVMEKEMETTI